MDGIDQNTVISSAIVELKKELVAVVSDLIKAEAKPDVMNKKTMCTEVLGCDPKTFDEYYQYQSGFPFMYKGARKVFSRRAVQKWIDANQQHVQAE